MLCTAHKALVTARKTPTAGGGDLLCATRSAFSEMDTRLTKKVKNDNRN